MNNVNAAGGSVDRLVLVGFGNMGRALVDGWLNSGFGASQLVVIDPAADAAVHAEKLGIQHAVSPADIDGQIDVAVLAVKPALIEPALQQLPPADLYLSIAAGRSLRELEQAVGRDDAAVVRAMPNTPAAIGRGVTGLCANSRVSDAQKNNAARLMTAVGSVEWLASESLMDALTAVSGSGPAYVFLLIECLAAAGVDAGLPQELAERLARQTVTGASAYAEATGADAATLRERVTSPNGTTAAALAVLQHEDGLQKLMTEAVAAAARRSRELGKAG